MKESEITTLAREYAEERGKLDREQGFPESFIKDMLEFNEKEFKSVLEFLLRRYCLVEKSKIKEVWSMITDVYLDHGHITYDGARYLFNEVLFPDLGKEVEG